jgi:hypothetical protein
MKRPRSTYSIWKQALPNADPIIFPCMFFSFLNSFFHLDLPSEARPTVFCYPTGG